MNLPRLSLCALVMFAGPAVAQTIPPRAPFPAATVAASAAPTSPAKLTPDEIAAERERFAREVLATIAGREKEPAETVFKNIQGFKGVPAGRLVAIMNQGYARSLGVSCTHCHDTAAWDSDDQRPKRAAREMRELTAKLNRELLPLLKQLDSKNPVVNCTTCHRGEVKPATDLARR
ncbi:MAG: hypothetical protein C0518_07735 [Opitutus sp.]|nr:hypothetical protein [Opitutus sp.]